MKSDVDYQIVEDRQFENILKDYGEISSEAITEKRENKIFDKNIISNIHLFFRILFAFALFFVFLYGDGNVLGKYIGGVFYLLLGYLRYLLPIMLILYGIFKYLNIFDNCKILYSIMIAIQICCNILATTLDSQHSQGGIVGLVIYTFLNLVFNDIIILLLVYTILLFSLYQIINLFFSDERIKIRVIDLRGSLVDTKKRLRLNSEAQIMQNIFKNFKIDAEITSYKKSISMNRYYVKLLGTTLISHITKIEKELALALGADTIDIGTERSNVYINVPNGKNDSIPFSKELKSINFKESENLSIPIGQNLEGETVYGNILRYPHMLIGGATLMGKSVLLNTIILSLLKKNTPDEIKFVMIDPKVVELNSYKDLPHLFNGVITEPDDAQNILNYLVFEMKRRNDLLAELGCRSLKTYNEKATEKLPYIMVVIDELAELMMNKKIDVETPIARLAQMARACGIHLIIATQRPEADIVTGIIKANILTRVALKVADGNNSRIILDRIGAEKLINAGDMLYLPNGKIVPEWLKGFFIDEKEIESMINDISKRYKNHKYVDDFTVAATSLSTSTDGLESEETSVDESDSDCRIIPIDSYFKDELTEKILLKALNEREISIPLIREWAKMFSANKKGVGSTRATRIINELVDKGFVSEEKSNTQRGILISVEDYEKWKVDELEHAAN